MRRQVREPSSSATWRSAVSSSCSATRVCLSATSPAPARIRERPVCALRAGPGRIPAGWWWRASPGARPDREARQGGPAALARRFGRRHRHPRGSAGTLQQIDQISGAYRSMSSSHACFSPFLARVTRAAADESSRTGFSPLGYLHQAAATPTTASTVGTAGTVMTRPARRRPPRRPGARKSTMASTRPPLHRRINVGGAEMRIRALPVSAASAGADMPGWRLPESGAGRVNMAFSCLSVARRLSRPSSADSPARPCAGQGSARPLCTRGGGRGANDPQPPRAAPRRAAGPG